MSLSSLSLRSTTSRALTMLLAAVAGVSGCGVAAPVGGPPPRLAPGMPREVSGRVISSEYEALGGRVDRAIVTAWSLPEMERVGYEHAEGDTFAIQLPPGEYRLVFSANGSRGATFDVHSVSILISEHEALFDVGTIDLPISRNTRLYGQPAPELEGVVGWKDTEPLVLSELRGRVIVLDFFDQFCTICHAHKPDLARLLDEYGGRGLVVLAVHDDSLKTMQELDAKMTPILREVFEGNVPELPMALDGSGESSVFAAYGIEAVPAVMLIDAEGRVHRRYHHAGVPDLEKDIRQLLGVRS